MLVGRLVGLCDLQLECFPDMAQTKPITKYKEFDTWNMELEAQISNEMLSETVILRFLVLKLKIKPQEINHPGRQKRKEIRKDQR